MAIKNNLTEFSTILILRDTPETRFAFGSPIDENARRTITNFFATDATNPYYSKLIDQSFRNGWRTGYPYIEAALDIGTPPQNGPGSDGSGVNAWVDAVRRNILQSIGADVSTSLGYNRVPSSAGTGIIVDDIFYVGSTSKKTYSGITTDDEVTVTGIGFAGIAIGSKIRLSLVTGTNLSTTTTYYAYAVGSTTLKLASSLANANEGEAITNATGSFSGSAELTVAASGATYTQYTDFSIPTPVLGVGDFLFWGDDASSLNIGGRILEVYTSGVDYEAGKRYKFEKNTKDSFPEAGGNIIPQNIYYYRKNWNGKDVKNNTQINANEIGGGFYVLIKIEPDNANAPLRYPYFGQDNPGENYVVSKLVDSTTPEKYIFLEHLRIRKISNAFNNQETVDSLFSGELIPCTMYRTSNFFYDSTANIDPTSGKLISLFGGDNVSYPYICPQWCAYYVNPYGGSGKKLDKNSVYVLEINERLPAVPSGDMPTKAAFYNFAIAGSI
jgi:hypothetical protein